MNSLPSQLAPANVPEAAVCACTIKELPMQNPNTLIKVGVVGSVVAALCCFTPVLFLLLGAVGLSALTGYLDYVLVPALLAFVGLTVYAVRLKRKAEATGAAGTTGEKQ